MIEFFARRTLWIIPVLLTVATLTFFLMHRAPGGPWDKERPIPAQAQVVLNQKFGLDKPLWFNTAAFAQARQTSGNPLVWGRALLDSQYFNYILGASRGDLGPSYQSKGTETVQQVIRDKFPFSLKIGLVALVFSLLIGIPLGIIAALKQNSWLDYFSLGLATLGVSVPAFIIGVLLIIFMSQVFKIAPLRRPEEWLGLGPAYYLPGFVLGLGTMAFIARLMRSSMLEIKRQDYVRTARAKGLSESRVIFHHMLRNGLIPVVTILGPTIADLVTGSFIIEQIFSVPGLGREFVTSIARRDYSMIMGTTLFYALLIAVANLSVDLSYGVLDPRIRSRR